MTPTSSARSPLLPLALLALAMVSTQGGASLAKSLFPQAGAAGTAALRLLFSALMLTLALRPWRLRLDRAGWRAVLLYGLSLGGMNLLFYLSLSLVPLGIAVALEFTGPLAVAVLASRRPADFAWIALAAGGLWALLPAGPQAGLDPLGVACALGAGACWALYIVFGRRASLRGGVPTVALASIVAAAAVLPAGLAQAGPSALFAPQLLPYALGVALLSSALPYALEVWVLARLPARVFGILLSLEPACAALSGLLFLGEALSALQWLGIAAVAAASAGITAARARR